MTMDVSTGAAVRAYRLGNSLPVTKGPAVERPKGPSFEDFLEKTGSKVVETIHEGNRAVVAGLRGEISPQAVVEATMAMETTIKTTVAVRDKLVEAYQEVLRMAV